MVIMNRVDIMARQYMEHLTGIHDDVNATIARLRGLSRELEVLLIDAYNYGDDHTHNALDSLREAVDALEHTSGHIGQIENRGFIHER